MTLGASGTGVWGCRTSSAFHLFTEKEDGTADTFCVHGAGIGLCLVQQTHSISLCRFFFIYFSFLCLLMRSRLPSLILLLCRLSAFAADHFQSNSKWRGGDLTRRAFLMPRFTPPLQNLLGSLSRCSSVSSRVVYLLPCRIVVDRCVDVILCLFIWLLFFSLPLSFAVSLSACFIVDDGSEWQIQSN